MEGKDVKSGAVAMVLAAVLFLPIVFQQVGNPISETLSLIDSTVETAAAINGTRGTLLPTPISTTSTSTASATSTMTSASIVSVTAVVDSISDDHAGTWNTFAPGKNSSGIANDYTWVVGIKASSTLPLTISSINIRHYTRGEAWSTSVSSYYPLVVSTLSGNQINTAYTQNLMQIPNGVTMLKVYGQTEATPFTGGTIQVIFTNGLSVSGVIPASSLRPATAVASLSIDSASTPTIMQATVNSNPATGSSTAIVSATFNARLTSSNGEIKISPTSSSSPAFTTLGSFVLMKNGVPMASIPDSFHPSLTITPLESSSFARKSSTGDYVLIGNGSGVVRLDLKFILQAYPSASSYSVKFIGPVNWMSTALGVASSTYPTGDNWVTPSIVVQ